MPDIHCFILAALPGSSTQTTTNALSMRFSLVVCTLLICAGFALPAWAGGQEINQTEFSEPVRAETLDAPKPQLEPDLGASLGSRIDKMVSVEVLQSVTSAAISSASSTAMTAAKTVVSRVDEVQRGIASWYHDKFQDRRTASGERYNMNALTAAHPSLPFGTYLCAHSPSTGKSTMVRINDRGPFIKGRIIDLSKAAAKALGIFATKPETVALFDHMDERCDSSSKSR